MNQPSSPPPIKKIRKRRRSSTSIKPWQFLTLTFFSVVSLFGLALFVVLQLTMSTVIKPAKENVSNQIREETKETKVNSYAEVFLPRESSVLIKETLLQEVESSEFLVQNLNPQLIWNQPYNVSRDITGDTSKTDEKLESIANQIYQLAAQQKLPIDHLSVILIDLNRQLIGHQQAEKYHYPASVPKLFWMVALYGKFEQGLLNESDFQELLRQMMGRSDNNATSQIIDKLTNAPFEEKGTPEAYNAWYWQRQQLNIFFNAARYGNLDITQKTYPIPDLQVKTPYGFDLQMRHDPKQPDKPIRNRLNVRQAARLMAEIATCQAISPTASTKMLQFLRRDLSQNWRSPKDYFNPVQYFFGEGLNPSMEIYSKAGWTSQGRHEVAYIVSPDQQQRYVLAVFADHKDYGENKTFFPLIAQTVQAAMQKNTPPSSKIKGDLCPTPTN